MTETDLLNLLNELLALPAEIEWVEFNHYCGTKWDG
jgi:hypothetical protein